MSVPAYPSYRDSGVTWLGDVPSQWEVRPLKHLAALKSGGTPSKDRTDFWNGSIPWASAKDLKVDRLDDTQDHLTEVALSEGAASTVPAGTVLVLVRGMMLARTFPVCRAGVSMALNQDLKALDARQGMLNAYLAWLLRGSEVETLNRLDEAGHGTKALRMEAWLTMPLPVPPIPEQAAIAAFLDRETAKIDALVEEQRRLVELLKEKRQAVISHAVTKGLDPTVTMKDSGVEWLGEVPAHWDVRRIGTLFREVSEPGDDELPMLSVSIHDGVSDDEIDPDGVERKVTRSEDRTKYKRVEPNDLVYNMMRAWQGGFGTVRVTGMVSPAYVVARPLALTPTQYVEHLLRTPKAVEEMRRRSRGVTDFRLRLYWDEFKDMRIAAPPESERQAILTSVNAIVEKGEALAAEAEAAILLLQERRSALISAAVTGKIDVRGLVHDERISV